MDELTSLSALIIAWISLGVLSAAWLLFAPRNRREPGSATRTGGALVAATGTLTALAAPFVPFGVYTQVTEGPGTASETTTRAESLWSLGIEPFQLFWLALAWGAALMVGISVSSGADRATLAPQATRWIAAVLLLALTWLASFSIGWMFVPVTLLALVTAIQGTRAGSGSAGVSAHDRYLERETGSASKRA